MALDVLETPTMNAIRPSPPARETLPTAPDILADAYVRGGMRFPFSYCGTTITLLHRLAQHPEFVQDFPRMQLSPTQVSKVGHGMDKVHREYGIPVLTYPTNEEREKGVRFVSEDGLQKEWTEAKKNAETALKAFGGDDSLTNDTTRQALLIRVQAAEEALFGPICYQSLDDYHHVLNSKSSRGSALRESVSEGVNPIEFYKEKIKKALSVSLSLQFPGESFSWLFA